MDEDRLQSAAAVNWISDRGKPGQADRHGAVSATVRLCQGPCGEHARGLEAVALSSARDAVGHEDDIFASLVRMDGERSALRLARDRVKPNRRLPPSRR